MVAEQIARLSSNFFAKYLAIWPPREELFQFNFQSTNIISIFREIGEDYVAWALGSDIVEQLSSPGSGQNSGSEMNYCA